jgi:FlaA1/EpsC-like NDP-sugar epimerase
VLFTLVYGAAFALRFDFAVPPDAARVFWITLPWIVALKLGVFYALGHLHGWWRYVTFADLVALLRTAGLSLFVIVAANYFFWPLRIPRSVVLLDFVLTVLALGALRSYWRVLREHFWPAFYPKVGPWAVLVGTDEATGVLAHQIQSQSQVPFRIRGLLTTNGDGKLTRLGQIPVLGPVDQVGQIAAGRRATEVLVTAGLLPGLRLRRLMDDCRRAGLNLKIIPALEDRLSGDHHVPIRNIEINDLLRREPVHLDHGAIAGLIENRTVLVTGGGGSIGSEICRQVLKFRPKKLVLVGRGENRIFVIERELRARPGTTEICSRIGDVTDAARMRRILEEFRPDVFFHAAAHKHVPLMEGNPGEAIKNNVQGTRIVADLAHEFGAHCFVLISTDKAVRPTSVMGATKHLAERYVLALSQTSRTRFVVTRFGNVLGSAGSVVPIFQDQIREGGPITVTDPRMTRYFMTIPEASQLVLQAAAMGGGGEIFVLDMGEPIRIVDLARDMIRLSGLAEDAIEIVFTGIRPGEKLYEQLYFEDEETLSTNHPKLRAAYHRPYAVEDVRHEVAELSDLAGRPEMCVCSQLRRFVPEFVPCCGDCEACPRYVPAAPRRVKSAAPRS